VRGFVDEIPVGDVTRFEQQLLTDVRANGKEILESIRDKQELDEETEEKLKKFLEDFRSKFS
jgi:F-type H+-transporting ATPase subunit alpha